MQYEFLRNDRCMTKQAIHIRQSNVASTSMSSLSSCAGITMGHLPSFQTVKISTTCDQEYQSGRHPKILTIWRTGFIPFLLLLPLISASVPPPSLIPSSLLLCISLSVVSIVQLCIPGVKSGDQSGDSPTPWHCFQVITLLPAPLFSFDNLLVMSQDTTPDLLPRINALIHIIMII